MQLAIRSLFILATGLVLTGSIARAQLVLSGHTIGSFDDLGEANTTINNAADGSWATFQTGIAAEGSVQSRIEFTNVNFSNVVSGEPIQIGLFNITNGMTEIGSGAPTARFNVGLQLTSPVSQMVAISTVNFHIDHTPNLPALIPDSFSVSFDQPPPVLIDNYLVQFTLNVDPLDFPLAENATTRKGDITVSFTPVPEPGTYALWGSALLIGFVAYRRMRSAPAMAANV
jgi:hypothetical protein